MKVEPRVRAVLKKMGGVPIAAAPQILFSAQSFLVGVIVARTATVSEFGQFAISFALWSFFTGLIRTTTTEVYIFQVPIKEQSRARGSQPLSAALLLSVIALFGLLLGAILIPSMRVQLVWLALSLPLFVVLDASRLLLVASGRGLLMSLLDIALVALISIGLFASALFSNVLYVLWSWTAVTLIAGAVALVLLRTLPTMRAGVQWFKSRHGIRHYTFDFLLTNSLAPIATVLAALSMGMLGPAAIRASQMIVAPVQILMRGLLTAFAMPARLAADGFQRKKVLGLSLAFALAIILLVVPIGAVIETASLRLLQAVFGDVASLARSVGPPSIIWSLASGLAAGAGLGLRVLGRISKAVTAKAISFPVALAGVLLGAAFLGPVGLVWGLAAGEVLRAFLSWLSLSSWLNNSSDRD